MLSWKDCITEDPPDSRDFASTQLYIIAYNKWRYHQRRAFYIASLGGVCARCEATTNLQFDHIDPATKSFDLGKIMNYKDEKVLLELEKCQLLCRTCHRSKSGAEVSAQRSVNHGEGLTGKKNCQCELCRPLKLHYAREYMRFRRLR